MKCPKCSYIGFETGDRCRNCGYEFALMNASADEEITSGPDTVKDSVEPFDLLLRPEPSHREMTPALPLFGTEEVDDEPLVRVTPPRPPVAVRKTPDANRMRPAPSLPAEPAMREAAFEFGAEPSIELAMATDGADAYLPLAGDAEGPAVPGRSTPRASARLSGTSTPIGPRVVAAVIDHGLLLAVDAIVIYFTLRLTALTLADWRLVPAAPLLTFLVGLKLAYLSAFTLAGGQTIGKMAAGIKVVADDDHPLNPWQVVQRAIVGVASLVALGAPFLMALPDPARRGLHDRVARTRVVPVS